MSKRILGLTLGLSTLAIAGWIIANQEKVEQIQEQEADAPSEVDENKVSKRPVAPKLNWANKTTHSDKRAVAAKRSNRSFKKVKPQKFDLIAKRRMNKSSRDESRRNVLAPKKMITKRQQNRTMPGDTPWIASLSGPDATVAMKISPEEEQSCLGSACDYMQDPAFNVAGVVLESERFGLKDESVLKGQLAQGDGKRTPFVYVE